MSPSRVSELIDSADAKHQLKDYQGAIADYDRVIQLDPNNAYAFASRGSAKYALKDYQGVIVDCDQAIQLDPHNALAFACRGSAYHALQDYLKAIIDYEEAIELDKDYATSFSEMIKGLKAHEFRGRSADDLFESACDKMNSEDLFGAIKYYEQVILLDPGLNKGGSFIIRGLAKFGAKKYLAAIEDFDLFIRTYQPDNIGAWDMRAKAKAKSGDFAGAIADYEQVIKLNKGDYEGALKEIAQLRELIKNQEQQKKEKNFAVALQQLKLIRKNNSMSLSELNRKYKELEREAFSLRCIDFYVQRGEFYYESAEKEANATRKNALYTSALQDFKQAMEWDPFAEGVAEKIEAINDKLKPSASVGAGGSPALFAPAPSQPLPERKDMTPEQVAKLEAIKAQMRHGDTSSKR